MAIPNLINYEWYSGRKTVGVVATINQVGWKAYIGPAEGNNEEADLLWISQYGAKLPELVARAIFEPKDENLKTMEYAS